MKLHPTDYIDSVALVKKHLNLEGIQSFEVIAEAMHRHKQQQIQAGLYSQDRFTMEGSHTEAIVASPETGKSAHCILWCLNHYTSLNRHPAVIQRVAEAVQTYGTGSGTSALSGGMSALHKDVETRIATLVGKQRAMLFPTGYTANLGVISALPGKNDFLLIDREVHASIIDGVKLSGRKFASFRHNSVEDLEQKLQKYRHRYDNVIQ
ncbi:MAG: aminotransferase class I/II-fold pyridoxal phosphate-dependent enzyme [Cyanobacteria bacterium P01_F01_bin.116]